ncbi:MAG: PilZ domain-containing protein [Marinobacter sp.]
MTTTDPYAFGNPDSEPEQDQRQEFRLAGRARVTLELEAAEPGGSTEARVAEAASSDVSAGGLRLVTDDPLAPGALLPAGIQLPGTPSPCRLTVEVVWCRPTEDGRWQSGLKILDTGDAGYLDWMEAVARAMEEG